MNSEGTPNLKPTCLRNNLWTGSKELAEKCGDQDHNQDIPNKKSLFGMIYYEKI